jgi:drug/metabolite transporter (DMT)-like permease
MNVGLILTPVSIYQMSRGALVLWVGILSVIFLRRHLWLYQWTALCIVVLGVCLVGLSGSLAKQSGGLPEGLMRIATSDDEAGKVALGVILILFAQNFTACQYVVEEKIMTRYKVAPLVGLVVRYEPDVRRP